MWTYKMNPRHKEENATKKCLISRRQFVSEWNSCLHEILALVHNNTPLQPTHIIAKFLKHSNSAEMCIKVYLRKPIQNLVRIASSCKLLLTASYLNLSE